MSWILTIIKAILFFAKSFFGSDAELKRFENRLQEIKNEMAKATNSDVVNYLDAERMQLINDIAKLHRRKQKSYTLTKK